MPRQVLSLSPLPTPEATRSLFVVWQRGKIGGALRTWLDLLAEVAVRKLFAARLSA